jgi:hypothetical protein
VRMRTRLYTHLHGDVLRIRARELSLACWPEPHHERGQVRQMDYAIRSVCALCAMRPRRAVRAAANTDGDDGQQWPRQEEAAGRQEPLQGRASTEPCKFSSPSGAEMMLPSASVKRAGA